MAAGGPSYLAQIGKHVINVPCDQVIFDEKAGTIQVEWKPHVAAICWEEEQVRRRCELIVSPSSLPH